MPRNTRWGGKFHADGILLRAKNWVTSANSHCIVVQLSTWIFPKKFIILSVLKLFPTVKKHISDWVIDHHDSFHYNQYALKRMNLGKITKAIPTKYLDKIYIGGTLGLVTSRGISLTPHVIFQGTFYVHVWVLWISLNFLKNKDNALSVLKNPSTLLSE